MADEGDLLKVEIYTDGGADPNPGAGGWGAVLISGMRTKEISGAEAETTNNRMELTAAISALTLLKMPCEVTLYTDSQYLRRGITEWLDGWKQNGWRKRNNRVVENADLWQALDKARERHHITWQWVKGHRGNPLNERADQLATEARDRAFARGVMAQPRPRERRGPASHDEPLTRIDVYPRGCALGVPGPSGYAATVLPEGDEPRIVSGGWPSATSNVMELWAVIAALRALPGRSSVTIHTTSKYVHDGATRWLAGWESRGWRTKQGSPVKNKEIWMELSRVMGDHDLHWEVVPRRKRSVHGETAARAAREQAQAQKDTLGEDDAH